jgi:diguanylate cyclase (GGDEF)-like protein
MTDIDYFKQYNDSYGHEKGDLALIAVAEQIGSMVESPDQIAVRWGGEEFIYVAFNRNNEEILSTANALRLKISDLKIPNPGSSISSYITVSSGICTGAAANREDINSLIKTADQTMYQAKNSGRNCVARPNSGISLK